MRGSTPSTSGTSGISVGQAEQADAPMRAGTGLRNYLKAVSARLGAKHGGSAPPTGGQSKACGREAKQWSANNADEIASNDASSTSRSGASCRRSASGCLGPHRLRRVDTTPVTRPMVGQPRRGVNARCVRKRHRPGAGRVDRPRNPARGRLARCRRRGRRSPFENLDSLVTTARNLLCVRKFAERITSSVSPSSGPPPLRSGARP